MRGLFVVVVLIATLVSQGTAQLPFSPVFLLSQYQDTEGGTLVVRLSAPILTRDQTPAFTGSLNNNNNNNNNWSDYLVNSQNPSSRTFTVTFQSKQANSTENVIELADDDIVEGSEAFRLRIVAARFIGQAASIFRAPAGLNNIVADVTIADDDFVEVSWIISEPIEVREGEGVRLELFAQAFGLYASPIEIGVVCAEVIAVGVPPAYPDRDFRVLSGSTLEFTDVETLRSNSSNNLTLLIIDDEIAEPCESFICTLQGGAVDRVRGVEPNRVTVRICDDDDVKTEVNLSITIQLHLRPVSDCLIWAETNTDAKLSDVSAALSVPLQQDCSCSLSVQQSFFSCLGTTDSQTVVFLARLSYTALPGVDMPSLLTSWVTSTPHIIVASTQLQVDPTCPVVIDSFEPEGCPVASTAPPTDPSTDRPASSTTVSPTDSSANSIESPTDVTVILTTLCVVVLLVVGAIVTIVIAVILVCRKLQSKNMSRPSRSEPNSVYESRYTNSGYGGIVQDKMTRNPSYVTSHMTGKGVTSSASHRYDGTEKESHTYELLPFEANEEGKKKCTTCKDDG